MKRLSTQVRSMIARTIEGLESTDAKQKQAAEGIIRNTALLAARGSRDARLCISQTLACDPKRVVLKLLADWARQTKDIELKSASLMCLTVTVLFERQLRPLIHKTLQ